MEDPFERKRLISDIIATLSTFKEKIKWVLTKDLKPRTLIGMKPDGTPVDIHDASGYPLIGAARPPQILLPEEDVAITGTTVVYSSTFTTKHYRYLLLGAINSSFATNPTTIEAHIQLSFGSILIGNFIGWDKEIIVINLPVTDGTRYWVFLPTFAVLGALATTEMGGVAPIPQIDASCLVRIVFTPTGSGTGENVKIVVLGVD